MKTRNLAMIASLGIPVALNAQHYNVLFIVVDDLRPELGCYGNPVIVSPNIDMLAKSGIQFNHAYCQMAISMATRASLLTGYLPEKYGIYKCGPVEEAFPGVLTLNKFFEKQGYQVKGMGKIYHYNDDHKRQFPEWKGEMEQPGRKWQGFGYLADSSIKKLLPTGRGPAFESPVAEDNDYNDGYLADWACKTLGELKDGKKPFFLAVGFQKPHLPFNAPKKYWDLYDRNKLKLAQNYYYPENAPKQTLHNSEELRNYIDIPKGTERFSDDLQRTLIHGYYACVSYVDANIGKVLDKLKELGLDKNTIVVLLGDHGWKLGEHSMWCKHTNFEIDTRSTLIIRAPGITPGRTGNFVEFIDIYPTLAELCGYKAPNGLDGISMVPVLKKPENFVRKAAFSLYPGDRENYDKLVIGYTVGTDRYRYTEWIHIKTGELVAVALYDHKTDPDENKNVAKVLVNEDVCKDLSIMLHKKYLYKVN